MIQNKDTKYIHDLSNFLFGFLHDLSNFLFGFFDLSNFLFGFFVAWKINFNLKNISDSSIDLPSCFSTYSIIQVLISHLVSQLIILFLNLFFT
jgi:hypothetical protein